MQLEELLAALQSAQRPTDNRFQVIPHEGGNTVIADNRYDSERPNFWTSPQGQALRSDNSQLSIQSAQRGQEQFNNNYLSSLLQSFRQGPLPDYDTLYRDPKWWELYSASPQLADRLYGASHDTSFTEAIKTKADEKKWMTDTLRGMIAKREIFQDAKGDWMQVMEEPDELGQMKKVFKPMSGEVASMMQRAGGLGLTDIKSALQMKQLADQSKQPPMTPPSSLQTEERSNVVPPMFGIPKALAQKQRGLNVEGLESLAVENPDKVPTYFKNLVTRFTGGELQPSPDPREIPRKDPQRLIINILRARKGLPPMSDFMWNEFLQGQGGRRMLQ